MKHTLQLLWDLEAINKNTDWMRIAEECSMEKQIEIRAELKRAIKRLDKELNNGK